MTETVIKPKAEQIALSHDQEPIQPPSGATIYKLTPEEEVFGVKGIYHTAVRTFREREGSQEEVPGTMVHYEPGTIYAYVTRRDLAAPEVNRIGELSAQLDRLSHVMQYIPKATHGAEDLIQDLRSLGTVTTGPQATTHDIDEQTTRDIED